MDGKKKAKEEIWDSALSPTLEREFRNWWANSHILREINIPRSLQRNFEKEEIHIFGDAGKDAYTAVAFLRTENTQGASVQLIQAKSRVAPLKRMSIPRLELIACTIATRLLVSIREALDFQNTPTFLWSDSTTALAWIRRNDEWGTFVGNRVREILQYTEVDQWNHVPGAMNPADLPSRGCNPSELLQSKWWEGPEWLHQSKSSWPHYSEAIDEVAVQLEKKKKITVLTTTESMPWYVKFGTYSSNVRLMGWIIRFINKCKRSSNAKGELTVVEIRKAENTLFKLVQTEKFIVKDRNRPMVGGMKVNLKPDGLIYLKTRLENREDTESFINPILLPSHHALVDQLVRENHLRNQHAGIQATMNILREKVWIQQTRRTVKRIIDKCVSCRRFNTKSPAVAPAPLPTNRVMDAKTFQVTGVDLAGPLFLKNKMKAWVVIFTCAVYRGVHLEMVTSLSTEDFLLALNRFISRRGRPSTIYSDNGTNFVGAANLFAKLDWSNIMERTRCHRIQWIFNPPSAAWWGGWWERLVRTLKDLLKRTLGRDRLNAVQLETCLCDIEATMNCRPLTYVTECPKDLIPLTPQMFLSDIHKTDFPEEECIDADKLRRRYRGLGNLKEELRSRFRKEYLAQLVHRGKSGKVAEFNIGDVVLVGSDNKKRQDWPIARISELIKGSDGNVRLARIKTPTGDFMRPLQRLYPLEVGTKDQIPTPIICKKNVVPDHKQPVKHDQCVKTRSGRAIRKPDRL